jgi:hypothetical protein
MKKNNSKTIRVTCTDAATLQLEKLLPLQGELKTITPDRAAKLRASILRHGITFPFFVWRNGDKNFIIDAHQRDKVLQGLQTEGWTVPPVPVAWIEAADEKEAREMADALRYEKCEHVWGEVINARGPSFDRTHAALVGAGYMEQAESFHRVSHDKAAWEDYARKTFLAHAELCDKAAGGEPKLRFLQYVTKDSRQWWKDRENIGAILL